MAGRQNNKYNATIRVNGIDVTVTANTPEELGHKIIAIQKPVRPTRTHQDYQTPFEEQICRYGMKCTKKDGICTRKHIDSDERPRTNSSSSSEEKPYGFCKYGLNCKNINTTCKFNHVKPCKAFQEGECKYGKDCKYTHEPRK